MKKFVGWGCFHLFRFKICILPFIPCTCCKKSEERNKQLDRISQHLLVVEVLDPSAVSDVIISSFSCTVKSKS